MSSHTPDLTFSEPAIDAIFGEVDQCHLPGCAVGIAIGGKPVYRRGIGLANMELPVVLSPSIRMRIYSITKHFTCFAYMLLCEDGKASIDDLLGKHLPEVHAVARNVTIRQLMTNTSGLRDANDVLWQFNGTGRNVTVTDLVSMYRDMDDMNFAPGTHWTYNNGGFVLLTAVVERIAGMPIEDVLRTRIFEPVGMHDTLLRRFDTDFVPNSATMHMSKPGGGFEKSYLGAVSGEGAIASTVYDMLRWMAHMDTSTVGSAKTWELMKAPQTLTNGTSTDYALGIFHGGYRGVEVLHHSGGGMGANSQMLKVPSVGLDIVIMVNRHDVSGMALADKILDVCLPGLEPIAASPPERAAMIEGTFRSRASGLIVQLKAATINSAWSTTGKQVAVIDGVEIPLRTDREDVWLPSEPLACLMKMMIEPRGERETPGSLRLTAYGNSDELVRQTPPKDQDASPITGLYRSDATGTEAKISHIEAGACLSTTGRFGSAQFTLECIADGLWCAKSTSLMPWGGILSFDAQNSGFHFSSGRTRKLPFRRCA
jgi:CubicO group peptidase (beta-lactamase class C family)